MNTLHVFDSSVFSADEDQELDQTADIKHMNTYDTLNT